MDINSYIEDLPSVEAASFDEYAQLMRLYILTAKKSDSFEGTKRLLTELYPDNAHFIYELLQNAEDAEATNVYFELRNDSLIFRHDGKKEFTLKDVKGITNIGNSTKKDDHTKVGKFGVGFKSVFAFTDAPKIYSREFNFEIQDMLLPVKIKANINRTGTETLFEFPFKGNADEKTKYRIQIEKDLCSLDENTIMFLDNISNIEYVLLDKSRGYVKKNNNVGKIYDIEVSAKRIKSQWLIFGKNINNDEHDGKSKLHVNISYALKKQSGKLNIAPTSGTVNIFFPAVKEISGLRFNINGPFASTVARDSIRECEENVVIFSAIADLVVESLQFIKDNKFISMGLYETMPNNEDTLNFNYSVIRERALDAFNNNNLVMSATDGFYKATDLVRTTPTIQNVFSFSEIKTLMGYDEVDWCCTIPVRNRNCRAFFESLNMRTYSYRMLSKLFDDEHRESFEKTIADKGLSWYRNLYLLLVDLSNSFQEGRLAIQYPVIIQNIQNTAIIFSANGTMKKPKEVYLYLGETPEKNDLFVNERLKQFTELEPFWQIIGIKKYDDKATAKLLLRNLEKYQYPNEAYFSDLLKLARNVSYAAVQSPQNVAIWFSEGQKGKFAAQNLYLDLPYENTGYANIACVIKGAYELSHIYKSRYSSVELEDVINFAKAQGIATGIEIVKSDVKKNPLYHEVLYKYSDNVTALSSSEDYSICGLDDLLDAHAVSVSRLLWNYMIQLQTLPRFCKATFSPNRTTQPRKCDSYLIQKFREKAWIPSSIDGRFYKPADISREMLPDDFMWQENSTFLNLILFATDKNKVLIQSEKLINDWGVDTESEQAKALRALLSNPQMASRILNMVDKEEREQYNLAEAIDAQNRQAVYTEDENEDIDLDENGTVRNVARRSRKIKEELEDGLKKPGAFKKIGLVSRTKTSPEERMFLFEQYHGKCQICGQTIKKWNGQNYFEGINLIATKNLSDQFKKSLEIGWNSLCLCPNHAAIYKYGSIDLSDLQNNVDALSIIDKENENIMLPIIMQGEMINIRYTPKHFLALKAAFEFFAEIENG